MINDVKVARAIIESFTRKLLDHLEVDVAIAGAGPAGLMAAYELAGDGYKVAVFEKRIAIGGGMWAGGIMFNEIVVQSEARKILDELGVPYKQFDDYHFTADAVLTMVTIAEKAMNAGAKIFNGMAVEDLVWNGERVQGFVINWGTIEPLGLPVDPIAIYAKYCIDATGHNAEVTAKLAMKNKVNLNTSTGGIMGEQSMFALKGEMDVVENTKEVYPGLIVAGMASNAVFGGHRMGPIFGGMLLSGKRAAEIIKAKIEGSK